MNKHTLGPWIVTSSAGGLTKYVEARIGNGMLQEVAVCSVCEHGDLEANSRLIAAAPELLEELNNCLDLLNTCFPSAPVDSCIGVAIVKARAAIAKATGETK